MTQEQSLCTRCDHRVVFGVACDGLPRACPYQVPPRSRTRPAARDAALDHLRGDSEYDAIRSDS